MWSTTEILEELRNHRQNCAKINIIRAVVEKGPYETDIELSELSKQCRALEEVRDRTDCWLELLPREERFIVQTHLVDGLDWAKTIVEHEKLWGIMNGRSERTLKRIQAKAICRIADCLNQLDNCQDIEKQ